MTIGEVAARANISASAIRYYESVGVLPQPERIAGRRRYGQDVLERLKIIAAAKRAGFSLDEVGELLAGADPAGETVRALAGRKLREVEALIRGINERREWLELAARCDCSSLADCPLFA